MKKAKSMLSYPKIIDQPEWQKELELMLAKGKKAEIQALSTISLSYLSDTYHIYHHFSSWIVEL